MAYAFRWIILPVLILLADAAFTGSKTHQGNLNPIEIIAFLWLGSGLWRYRIYRRTRIRARAWHDEYRK